MPNINIYNPAEGQKIISEADWQAINPATGKRFWEERGYSDNANLTPPAPAPVIPAAPTMESIYTPPAGQAISDQAKQNLLASYGIAPPVQTDIYKNQLGLFQSEIDALNNLYAQKKSELTAQYAVKSEKELGSLRALQAGTGMLGQFGGLGQKSDVQLQQEQRVKGATDIVEAELQSKIAAIRSGAQTQAQSIYDKKLEDYRSGQKGIIENIATRTTVKSAALTNQVKISLLNGWDLSNADNAKQLSDSFKAGNLDVSVNEIMAEYKSQKTAKDTADKELAAKQAKEAGDLALQQSQIVENEAQTKKTLYDMTHKAGDFSVVNNPDGSQSVLDKNTGKLTNLTTSSGQPTIDTSSVYTDFISTLNDTGKKVFGSLSEGDKLNVMQLIKGDALSADIAKGIGGAKYAQRLLGMSTQVDPTFSENTNKIRYNAKKNWDNPQGKAFLIRTSINTTIGHLAELKLAADALSNKVLNKYNTIANMVKKETGDSTVTDFNYILNVLSSEIAFVYKGTGASPTDDDVQAMKNSLSLNYSPKQLSQVIDKAAKLLTSKITSMGQEYKGVMGEYPEEPIVQTYILQQLKDAGVDTSSIDKSIQNQTNQSTIGGSNNPQTMKLPNGTIVNLQPDGTYK